MRPSDKPEFVAILNGMAAVKPNANLTKEAYEIWWNAMQGWGIEDFRSAASHLVSAVQFMPNPYDFDQLRKASRMTSGEAWLKAVASIGSARVPGGHSGGTSGDPLIDRAVRAIGGFGAIAMCDLDKLPFMERRFCEHYAEMGDAENTREAVPQLTQDEAKKALGKIGARLAISKSAA